MDDVRIISPRVPFTVVKDRNNGHLSREGYTFLRDALNGLSNRINFLEMQLAQEASALPLLAETVKWGTYTPTLTTVTNVASSAAFVSQYVKIGGMVCVSFKINVKATASGTLTEVGLSLPIASNFSSSEQCGGAANASLSGEVGVINADATNNRARFTVTPTNVFDNAYYCNFMYQII